MRSVGHGRPGLPGQALEVARVELRAETRTGEVVLVAAPFGAAALLLLPLAVGADVPLLRQVGWGMFWIVVLLFGTLVTARGTAANPAAGELLVQLGVAPAARFMGRTAASAVLLVAFQIVLVPVMVVLYDPGLAGWWWLGPLVVLVAVGLAALGTLAVDLAGNLTTRGGLVPLLVVPLSVPLLLAGTQVTTGAIYGRSPLPWLGVLLAADLLVVTGGLLSAESLEEAT